MDKIVKRTYLRALSFKSPKKIKALWRRHFIDIMALGTRINDEPTWYSVGTLSRRIPPDESSS